MACTFVVNYGMFLGMVLRINDMHIPFLHHQVSWENIGASAWKKNRFLKTNKWIPQFVFVIGFFGLWPYEASGNLN